MMPLRVVLAGLGVRGRYWAEVLTRSSRSTIAAYADPNPDALARAVAQFGERPRFASAEAALDLWMGSTHSSWPIRPSGAKAKFGQQSAGKSRC